MLRANLKYLWIVAAVAMFLSVGASTSQAFWHHHHGCGCPACCLNVIDPCCPPVLPAYSVAYSPCCPSFDCVLGIRPGPIRRAVFGPYRWYCGYNIGGPVFYSGFAAPCCEATPSTGGALTPTPATPTPVQPQTPPPATAPTTPATPPKATSAERPDAGQITIWVPENAKVFVNGYETKSTGNLRQFVSYGLKPGMGYDYTIRAVVVRDGRSIEESHTVKLVAGQRSAVAFSFKSPASSSLASVW